MNPVVGSTTRGLKRKSDIAPSGDDEQSEPANEPEVVTTVKKAKKTKDVSTAPFCVVYSDLCLQSMDPSSNPPQGPAPRQILKAGLAGKKKVSESSTQAVSGDTSSLEITDKQPEVAKRKHPAEDVVVDEGAHMVAPVPGRPSKRVKGSSNVTRNKPQALRRTGLFLHIIWLGIRH